MPFDYDEMKEEFNQFKESIERVVKEAGVEIVNKKDLDKHPGMYGISLRDLMEGKEIKQTDEIGQEDED